ASTETLGAVTLASGASTIATAPGSGQNATLTLTSLTRSAGATVNFSGSGLGGANKVVLTTAPGLTNSILPWATVNGSDFATHGGNGTSIAAFAGYVGMPSGGGAGTENVRL